MSDKRTEIIAVLTVVLGAAGVVSAPFVYEARAVVRPSSGVRVITLTAVAATGTWTEENVTAGNYWNHDVAPARLVLRAGEAVRLRLKSSDVVHSFYVPGLGVGPVEAYPGHVAEVELTPGEEGVFQYYCTAVCGRPHWGMRGEIVVAAQGASVTQRPAQQVGKYWLEPPPAAGSDPVERGKWLYRRQGCFLCHGPEGRGGVSNRNYVKDTVPALNTLSERLMLFEPEDIAAILGQLKRGQRLESLEDSPPIPRFNVFMAQYRSVQDLIRRGNPAGKKDPKGPVPPLRMPSWAEQLSDSDIDALIAYFLSLPTQQKAAR